MCVTKGDSDGKNPQAISKALPCQNSLSALICATFIASFSFELTKNLSSVDTQKYEIVKNEIFSNIESLLNSTSIYYSQYKSCMVNGVIYIILPILSKCSHSDWFKYPSKHFILMWLYSKESSESHSSFVFPAGGLTFDATNLLQISLIIG